MRWLGICRLFCFSFCASLACACSCSEQTPPCQSYWEATAVFEGTVTQISSLPVERKVGEQLLTYAKALVHFTVEKSHRGVPDTEVELTTGLGGGDCGYSFHRGERYLVYARPDPETKKLNTSICMLTKRLTDAGPDLAYIRSVPAEPVGTRLYGTVLDYTAGQRGNRSSSKGLPGAAIELTGPAGVRGLRGNHLGGYEWTNLPVQVIS